MKSNLDPSRYEADVYPIVSFSHILAVRILDFVFGPGFTRESATFETSFFHKGLWFFQACTHSKTRLNKWVRSFYFCVVSEARAIHVSPPVQPWKKLAYKDSNSGFRAQLFIICFWIKKRQWKYVTPNLANSKKKLARPACALTSGSTHSFARTSLSQAQKARGLC